MVERILKGQITVPVNKVETIVSGDDQIPLHKHEVHAEWYEMIKGSGILTLGEKIIEMQLFELYEIPPGTPHAVKPGKGGVTFTSFYQIEGPDNDVVYF